MEVLYCMVCACRIRFLVYLFNNKNQYQKKNISKHHATQHRLEKYNKLRLNFYIQNNKDKLMKKLSKL